MSKFKVGDRVDWIDSGELWQNAEVIEVAFSEVKNTYAYTIKEKDGGVGYLYQYEIKSSNSPIRTVTRKDIVPGNYGIVAITKSNKVMIAAGKYTADQLREAAHTLNQIAEALEDDITI